MPKPSTKNPKLATRTLREHVSQDGLTVQESVLTGVKVLGAVSVNRRRYTLEAMQQGLSLYEGVVVNLNHPSGDPHATRDLRDRFGRLENVRIDGGSIRADLRYNPKQPLAESVAWWAQHMPECLGLSHNAVGQGKNRDGVFVVEKIVSVRSVDLVADPATNKGLYEADMADDMNDDDLDATGGGNDTGGEGGGHEEAIADLVNAIMGDEKLSKADKRSKILKALNLLDDDEEDEEDDDEDEEDEEDEEDDDEDEEDEEDDEECGSGMKKGSEESVNFRRLRRSKNKHVRRMVEQLDRYRVRERLSKRLGIARRLCRASGLPGVLVTTVFLEQVAHAPNRKAMRALIEDRRALSGRARPRSAGPASGRHSMSLDEFATALTEED